MKSYNQFIKESKNSIESICKEYGIKNYTINSDGSIDVDGGVYINSLIRHHHRSRYNTITKLPLRFRNVTGDFNCCFNKLTTLEGCPQSVGGDFHCGGNQLNTLEGSPESVGGNFYCEYNHLKSLEGISESIGGVIYCRHNFQMIDFKGVSEYYEGNFYCDGNPIEEIYLLFKTSKCIKWINEYDVIRGNKVVMDLLEEVFHQLGMDVPEEIEFENYEII